MSRLLRATAVATLAAAVLVPAAPASASCHEVVPPIVVPTPLGPVRVFPGIYIPC